MLLANALGETRARAVSGNSARRPKTMQRAAAGRNTAVRTASLDSASDAYKFNIDQIRNRLKISNDRAFSQVKFGPVESLPIPEPAYKQGPSPFELATNLCSSILGGVQAAIAFRNKTR